MTFCMTLDLQVPIHHWTIEPWALMVLNRDALWVLQQEGALCSSGRSGIRYV